jgi:hypothetical protein
MRFAIVLLALLLSACGSGGGGGGASTAKSPSSPAVVAQSPWIGTYTAVSDAPGDTAPCFVINGKYQCQYLRNEYAPDFYFDATGENVYFSSGYGGNYPYTSGSTHKVTISGDSVAIPLTPGSWTPLFNFFIYAPVAGIEIQQDPQTNLVVVEMGDTAALYTFTPNGQSRLQ